MRFFVAAILVGVASGACVATDVSGLACAVYSTQNLCSAGAMLGCQWDAGNNKCFKDTSICATKTDATSCNSALPAGTCGWNTPGVCDQADILPCVGGGYGQCIVASVQLDLLTAAYANLNITVDLTTHIQANVDKMLCSCLPIYFNCIYSSDCGRDPNFLLGWNQACATTFTQLTASRPGLAGCSSSWCNVGRTASASVFTVTFTFSASNLPASWSQTKKDAFVAALRAELVGVDSSWISFNAATGVATVTIPAGTSISADQLNGIQVAFNSWSNPSSSNAAPMFNAMGVEGAQVTAEPAPFETSAGTRAGSSFVAAIAIALAFAKLL